MNEYWIIGGNSSVVNFVLRHDGGEGVTWLYAAGKMEKPKVKYFFTEENY